MLLGHLETMVRQCLERQGLQPTVKSRVKSFDSLFKKTLKLMRGRPEGDAGRLPVIGDLLGLRVVCPFLEDLRAAEEAVRGSFDVVEVEHKGSDLSFREFAYDSTHLLLRVPLELDRELIFEVQVRTTLQDAWAEVEHDLVYKAEFTPFDEPMKRKLAALNANLSLSDIIFQEIRDYQRRLHQQLAVRRSAFFDKVEESTDGRVFGTAPEPAHPPEDARRHEPNGNGPRSMDDMLLDALSAHNRGDFDKAEQTYTAILALNPKQRVRAIVNVHRGMAHFATSKYPEAVADFTEAMRLDEDNYKAPYYRGVVHTCLEDYAAAVSDYNRSLEINPYQPFVLYRRAQAYYHLGDLPKALVDGNKALALEPDSVPLGRFLDLVKRKLRM
jgi:putative GTP pyrophosphokinase